MYNIYKLWSEKSYNNSIQHQQIYLQGITMRCIAVAKLFTVPRVLSITTKKMLIARRINKR